MLNIAQVESTLLFFGLSYIICNWRFRETLNDAKKRKRGFWTCFIIFSAVFVVKMSYDMKTLPDNLYTVLECSRHHNVLDIRKSYKNLSKRYHPDKNPDVEAQLRFQQVKSAYDIMLDEGLRDTYNRFGPEHLEFDPRKDEMQLVADIGIEYMFWGAVGYIMTLPKGARASRTWIVILGIVMMAAEVFLLLTETTIPDWFPPTLTEYELLFYSHSVFALLIVILRALSESLYVDPDKTSISVLKEVYDQQKNMGLMIREVESMIQSSLQPNDNSRNNVEDVLSKIGAIREKMESSSESYNHRINDLRNSSSNPGSNYYWIIFVLLYGGIFFLQ